MPGCSTGVLANMYGMCSIYEYTAAGCQIDTTSTDVRRCGMHTARERNVKVPKVSDVNIDRAVMARLYVTDGY